MKPITQYFFRGLITFLPLALTVYVLYLTVAWIESIAIWLIRPFIGDFYLPGLGIVLGAGLILGLGFLISQPNVARWLSWIELPFTNLPVDKETQQQAVVVLRMPGNEMSIVGLVTRQNMQGLPPALAELDQVAVYLPMGYMIGGYTVFVPRSWITPIDMSVEEAMRSSLLAWMASNRTSGATTEPVEPTEPNRPMP